MSRLIKTIVIHCSAGNAATETVETIRRYHVEVKGWSDIGYHYLIERTGTVRVGRPESVPGAHVRGHNADSLGVCLLGGRDEFDFTRQQMRGLEGLIGRLLLKHEGAEVRGHRSMPSVVKACPRFNARTWWYGDQKTERS